MTDTKQPEARRLSNVLAGMKLPTGYNQGALEDSSAELLRQASEHQTALRRAEETGYARGLQAAALLAADKAGGEVVAYAVYAGILDKRMAGRPHKTQEEAERAAKEIKSETEIRPLYTHPQPQPSALPDDVVKDAERYFPTEFEVWQDDEMCASASGPRNEALREAMRYASQYEQDGPVRVFEVTRTLIDAAMLKEGK